MHEETPDTRFPLIPNDGIAPNAVGGCIFYHAKAKLIPTSRSAKAASDAKTMVLEHARRMSYRRRSFNL